MHSYPHTFLFLIIFVSLNSSKVILKTLFVPNELSYHFYSHKSVNSYCYCYSFHSILFSNKNKKKLSLFLISQLIQHAMTVKIDGKAIPQLSVVLSHPIDYLFSFLFFSFPYTYHFKNLIVEILELVTHHLPSRGWHGGWLSLSCNQQNKAVTRHISRSNFTPWLDTRPSFKHTATKTPYIRSSSLHSSSTFWSEIAI